MENENILDPIIKIKKSRYSRLSFKALIISLSSLLLFLLLSILNIGNAFADIAIIILLFGFVFSNIAGLIFTALSLFKQETNTNYKTVGGIGNILFFFVMVGMLVFVLKDVIT